MSSLASRAETVFLGQVTAVRVGGNLPSAATQSGGTRMSPAAALPAPAGVVLVEFRVDTVMKGSSGETYTLREWSGLWPGGTPRYWVGERAVMFVSAASGAGFSGPVDGMEGVLPVAGFQNAEPMLDLTRVRSSLQRVAGAPMADAGASLSLGELQSLIVPPSSATQPTPMEWQPYPGRLPAIQENGPATAVRPARSVPDHTLRSLPLRSLPHPEVQ